MMINKRKKYLRIERLYETRGEEKESFTDFLYNLEAEGIISLKEWRTFTKIFEKKS